MEKKDKRKEEKIEKVKGEKGKRGNPEKGGKHGKGKRGKRKKKKKGKQGSHFTHFTLLNTVPPVVCLWARKRLREMQAISKPEKKLLEVWSSTYSAQPISATNMCPFVTRRLQFKFSKCSSPTSHVRSQWSRHHRMMSRKELA